MESWCFCAEQGKDALGESLTGETQTRVGGAGLAGLMARLSLSILGLLALNQNFRKPKWFVGTESSLHAATRAVLIYCDSLAFFGVRFLLCLAKQWAFGISLVSPECLDGDPQLSDCKLCEPSVAPICFPHPCM